jgi:type IV secretory pathway VirB9-like protein
MEIRMNRIIVITLTLLVLSNIARADVSRDVKAIKGGENLTAVTGVDTGGLMDIKVPEAVNLRSTQEKFFHIEGKETIKTHKWSRDKLIKINTRMFMESMIVLPEDERIVTIYSGDKRFFRFSRPENFPYMLAIQPTEEGIDTSLQVISESGRIYLFYVRSLPIKTKTTPDLLVYVDADNVGGRVETISNASSLGQKSIFNKTTSSASSLNQKDYLHSLGVGKKVNGNYKINGSEVIAPQAVYDDGKWTYFDFRNIPSSMDRPAIYKITDKKQTLVNTRRMDGHIIAETLSGEGWMLELGSQIVCIKSLSSHNYKMR